MSTDAALGSDVPFDPRIQRARNQPGQAEVASHPGRSARRQRDPQLAPRLRSGPGPLFAALPAAGDGRGAWTCWPRRRHLEREANGVSDNPLVFVDEGEILSGGNFHAEPVAFAADKIAVAHGRDRQPLRAPDGAADRPEPEQPAGVPDPATRA